MTKFTNRFESKKDIAKSLTMARRIHKYILLFNRMLGSKYLDDLFDDGQQILDASRNYYLNAHPQLFAVDEQDGTNPLVVYIDKYHKRTSKQLQLALKQKCYIAHAKAAAIVRVERNESLIVFTSKIKEALLKAIRKHHIWKTIYPALRLIISGFEQQMENVVRMSLSFGVKVVHLIPYNFDAFIISDMSVYLYKKGISAIQRALQTRLQWFFEYELSVQYNIIVHQYQEIATQLTGKSENDAENTTQKVSFASKTQSIPKQPYKPKKGKTSKQNVHTAVGSSLFGSSTPSKKKKQRTSPSRRSQLKLRKAPHRDMYPSTLTTAMKTSKTRAQVKKTKTFTPRNFELESIKADINGEYKKLKYDKNMEMTLDNRMAIQRQLEEMTTNVNRIIAKWMKNLYDNIVEDIEANIQ